MAAAKKSKVAARKSRNAGKGNKSDKGPAIIIKFKDSPEQVLAQILKKMSGKGKWHGRIEILDDDGD